MSFFISLLFRCPFLSFLNNLFSDFLCICLLLSVLLSLFTYLFFKFIFFSNDFPILSLLFSFLLISFLLFRVPLFPPFYLPFLYACFSASLPSFLHYIYFLLSTVVVPSILTYSFYSSSSVNQNSKIAAGQPNNELKLAVKLCKAERSCRITDNLCRFISKKKKT